MIQLGCAECRLCCVSSHSPQSGTQSAPGYKNLTTCNSNEPLDIHSQIESLGRTEETALVVTVPVQVRTRARVGSKEEVDEVPTKRRKVDASSSKWEWKEDEPVYSVEGGTLFFVNRDRAMQQLLESHKSNFYRAVTGSGSTWIIPLVDHVLGLGKTELGGEYIRRCRHEWDILSETDKTEGTFMDIIHRCHMIRIQFSQNDLLDDDLEFDSKKADKNFVGHIYTFFKETYATTPHALSPDPLGTLPDPASVLRKLTLEVGPLLIVIDEIGRGFKVRLSDITKRERFLSFCDYILEPLFSNKNLFLLVAGRAMFMDHVDSRPRQELFLATYPFTFRRLSLHLLQPAEIKEVIQKTYWKENKLETIQEHYKLDDVEVEQVAAHLFTATLGHPLKLLAAFRTCDFYDELVGYETSGLLYGTIDWHKFGDRLCQYEAPLRALMDHGIEGVEINLSRVWRDQAGETITYDAITDMFGIMWDGDLENAKIHMPVHLQRAILTFYPFREFLENVTPAIGKVVVEYPDEFELLILTRLHDLFHEETCPSKVLSDFFTDNQEFGRCAGVKFAGCMYRMPIKKAKETTRKQSSDEFVEEINVLVEQLSLNHPTPKSTSPNIMLMTTASNAMPMVGLVARNCEIGVKLLQEECDRFDNVCIQLPKTIPLKDRLNVLIVCATSYDVELRAQFKVKNGAISKSAVCSSGEFEGVDEVILLNLSTPENRADFFRLHDDPRRKDALEKLIAKAPVSCFKSASQQ